MEAFRLHSEITFLCFSSILGSTQELKSMVRLTSTFGCSLNDGGRYVQSYAKAETSSFGYFFPITAMTRLMNVKYDSERLYRLFLSIFRHSAHSQKPLLSLQPRLMFNVSGLFFRYSSRFFTAIFAVSGLE